MDSGDGIHRLYFANAPPGGTPTGAGRPVNVGNL